MIINRDQYLKMLSFMGYGNYPETDILFFGIEEGTGDQSYENNIRTREEVYGQDQGQYIFTLNEDWKDGFWESRGPRVQEIRKEYLEKKYGIETKIRYPDVPFLRYCSRIQLALEDSIINNNKDISQWFLRKNEDPERFELISKFTKGENSQLFCQRDGIQSALFDWRPLPRKNEKDWPEEYSVISKEKYLNGFDKLNGIQYKDDFSNYSEDAKTRVDILENIIGKFKIPIIISSGKVDVAKRLLRNIFGQELFFEERRLQGVSPKGSIQDIYVAKLRNSNNLTTIFLCTFFDEKLLTYEGLHDFVKKHLVPAYKEAKGQ